MRKVLSFVLVLSLVLGSFGMAFASYSDMADQPSAEAVDVLAGLGVISGYPDGTFKPGNIVTRAEMAKLIVAALGLEEYATATTSKYSDMGAAPWAQGFVAYGTSLGFISGYPDGTFRPNATVSYEEACSMILRALGYTSEFLPGEWPAEWVVKAKSLGILDGVKAATSAGANRGDIAEMLYNSLALHIGYVDKDGVWQDYVEKKNNKEIFDTMLGRLGATFVEADDAPNGGVIHGDEGAVINLRPFVGAYADRYVNKDDKIIKVVPVSEFVEGKFTSATVFKATDGTEYKLGKDVSDEAPFFVNGAYKTVAEKDDITKNLDQKGTLAVEIDGKYFSEIYSVMYWVISDDFKVDKDDLEELDEDNALRGSEFALTTKDEIDMDSFELLGIDDLDDLKEDYVVYLYNEPKAGEAYGSETGDIRRIAVGTEVITGEVTRLRSNDTEVTVGGKTYEMWSGAADKTFSFKLGAEVELYLDYFGDVYEADTLKAKADSYAILLDKASAVGGVRSEVALAKLFLADGTTKTFDVDDDFDSNIIDDGEWKDTATAGIVVEYGVNKDGVIDSIAEVDPWEDTIGTAKELTTKGYYDGESVSKDATLFTYNAAEGDNPLANKDSYDVTTVAKATEKTFKAGYHVDSSSKKVTVMLIVGLAASDDDIYGVVVDKERTSASSTDYLLKMLVDGKAVEYEATRGMYDAADYNKLYKVSLNASDAVSKLDEATPKLMSETADWTKATEYAGGKVTLTGGASVTVRSDAVVYMWDADDEVFKSVRVSKGNLADNYLKLYAVDDEDVADIILVVEDADYAEF